jgi:putative membrane protein
LQRKPELKEEDMDMRIAIASTAALAAAFALGAAAQTRSSTSQPENRSIVTAEAAGPRSNTNAAHIEFLTESLRTSLAEIRLGELATRQSHDARVREYGAKLRTDHTAQAKEIEQLLEPLGVAVPTEPSAEALTQQAALERLSGTEFDAAFVQMMVWSHTEAIEKYGAQTHANPNRALHDFASNSLPMLREHLATAESLR